MVFTLPYLTFALNIPVLNSTTVDFEALQLSNSDSFVTDSECPVVDNGPCEISNVSRNWKAYREVKDKTKNLESIIQSLSSPIKHTVRRNLASSVLMDVISIHETTIVTSLIDYLKELNKQGQYPAMHKTMHSVFKNKMNDTNFLKWLASMLNIRTSRFLTYVANWRDRNFTETKGNLELQLELRQKIDDTWVENSISSRDCRNGWNIVNISKRKYFSLYKDIRNEKVVVEEKINKRGHVHYQANRMVLTCTVRSIQKKISDSGTGVSLGKIVSLKPFFITYPTEKEMSLFLCTLCLNVKMLLEPLMAKAKKDNDVTFESATEFFMSECKCEKGGNSYYKWKCCNLKCNICRNIKQAALKCQHSEETVKVSQFELTITPYKKTDKNGVTMEKLSKKTGDDLQGSLYKTCSNKERVHLS